MGSSSPSAGKPRIPALFTTPQSPGKRRKHRAAIYQENNSIRSALMSWMVPPEQNRDDLQLEIHIPHSLTSHYHLPMSQKSRMEISWLPKTLPGKRPTHLSRGVANSEEIHLLSCYIGTSIAKREEKKLYLHFAPSLRLPDRPPWPEWHWWCPAAGHRVSGNRFSAAPQLQGHPCAKPQQTQQSLSCPGI